MMGSVVLEGETLGQKHQHYNKLLKEITTTNASSDLKEINYNEPDVDNLLKIDIANYIKNVDYILEVLKCEDMLYVSRALKKCTWLIIDTKYAYIINPNYLYTKLLPQMTSKAGHKLTLTIRLNLKDEERVELFFKYFEENNELKTALKWLPNCSKSFIENIVEKYAMDIPIPLLKILCEKSTTVLEIFTRKDIYKTRELLSKTMFLLKNDTEIFLDIINKVPKYNIPEFKPKSTKTIMKTKPEIIFNNFENFATKIDIPTFLKYIKTDDIESFLTKHLENKNLKSFFNTSTMKHFIFRMPSECRFDFVKRIFIERNHDSRDCGDISPRRGIKFCSAVKKMPQTSNANIYKWYVFAPFSTAFTDLKKLIRIESNPNERNEIFAVLIKCARRNSQNLQTILQYYREEHMNEPFKFKSHFVNLILSHSNSHRFDGKTWAILNEIFCSMDVYSENENNVQTCLKHIIVYKIIHDTSVPETVENKIIFDTLQSFQSKLNDEEKDKVFNYLYQFITTKIQNTEINSRSDLKTVVKLILNVLNLLSDWKKNILHYDIILKKIKEIIKINVNKCWNEDLSGIYKVNKSWRKHMFNESLLLHFTRGTCINALKHGPELLLTTLSKETAWLNYSINSTQLLSKIRIYWPRTLAKTLEDIFRHQLINKTKHKISIPGLCILLPQKEIIDVLNKYKPINAKIIWTGMDDVTLSIQKCFAKNMLLARPHPPVDVVLLYAKGDYLQFVLPSLYSILFNISSDKSIKYIPSLLDSPVSLQKHSLKIAFAKLKLNEILVISLKTWKSTKNASIRATLFKLVCELLWKEQSENMMKDIWNVLDMFIGTLTADENKSIYVTLAQAKKVPVPIRQAYCIKSYKFLKDLPCKKDGNELSKSVIKSILDIMESIDIEFVVEIILDWLDKNFTDQYYVFSNIISSCLLSTKSEGIQTQRYKKVFVPFLKKYLVTIQTAENKQLNLKLYFKNVLMTLFKDVENITINKNMITPINLFNNIYQDLEASLSSEEDYVFITTWKLAAKYMLIIEKHRNTVADIETKHRIEPDTYKSMGKILYLVAAPEFGKICIDQLKEETTKYFPSIYILYSKALNNIFSEYNFEDKTILATLKAMQQHADTIEGHLLILSLIPPYLHDTDKEERSKIWTVLSTHPSAECQEMAELELDGYTLGQKHQRYNTLVQDAIRNNQTVKVEDFDLDNPDIINLMNIDIASHNKNVKYILKIFTCNDMLYISRAIKQSYWLINDQRFAHIINPVYFRTNLFPEMCSKAITKLIKYIRKNLKDEKRGEEFYSCEVNPEEAAKWLPCCSLEFIQEHVTDHIPHLKTTLLRRMCEKCITVLEIYTKKAEPHENRKALQTAMFLLSSNTEKFLDVVEATNFPTFNKKATTILMKTSSNRVIEKFDKYYNFIHLPTFISYLKHENIRDFLLNQAQKMNDNHQYRLFNLQRLQLFIRYMPKDIRFEFVKQVFIDKIYESNDNCILSDQEKKALSNLCNIANTYNRRHIWYQFAPFKIALQKIQELFGSVLSPAEKISMLNILLTSTHNNLSDEHTFLEYLRDRLKNIKSEVKENIVIKLIQKNNFINYDIRTWNILDDIFKSLNLYNESESSENVIIEAIIIYKIIHNKNVPSIVENKFYFNSLVPYHKKLSETQKEMVFIYLYELIMAKITNSNITNEKAFEKQVHTLESVLNLLNDFKKELDNYPTVLCAIKDLVKIKNNVRWTLSIQTLYNIKKSWRKLLFSESFTFCQTESVLLNALKHDPALLEQNNNIVKNMLCDDKTPIRQVLDKIKIYWSSSLANAISIMYTEKLLTLGDHKATTRGICILLPHKRLKELVEKYAPKEAKIDWANIDEVHLSVQQQFAKTMHISRPQLFPEFILQFAKGDYLQYALPALQSIFYNLNILSSQKYIPKLLDAPVSLQKHGIRLALSKLKSEQLIYVFSNIWKNNKNPSIRSVMFVTVYKLICREKDSKKIKTIWELIEMFIGDLTFKEDKAIYKLLFQAEKVPLEVRGKFYMKSYNFLHKLINCGKEHKIYEHQFYTTFTIYSKEIIEHLESYFIVQIILEFIATEFIKQRTEIWSRGCVISIISSYLLCAPDERTQLDRYKKVLMPILKQSFCLWNTEDFIAYNLTKLLNALRSDIKQYVLDKKYVNPHKMLLLINAELKHALEIPANYMLLTKWQLTVTFVVILNANNPILNWEESSSKVAYEFGNKCNDYLKKDCNKYFPRIYLLFVEALNSTLSDLLPKIAHLNVYRSLIHDKTFIEGYLAAIILLSKTSHSDHDEGMKKSEKNLKTLCKTISEHPSTEVKIHYHNRIKKVK